MIGKWSFVKIPEMFATKIARTDSEHNLVVTVWYALNAYIGIFRHRRRSVNRTYLCNIFLGTDKTITIVMERALN